MSYRCTSRLEKKQRVKRGEGLTRSEPDWFYPIDRKKPSQIEHRIGKSWIYTFLNMRVLFSQGRERISYFKDEESQFLAEFKVKPDDYAVIERDGASYEFIFGEYQDNDNAWDKNYSALFESRDPSQNITLLVVTSESNPTLERRLRKEFAKFSNVRLRVFTLTQIREYVWKIVLKEREKKLLLEAK